MKLLNEKKEWYPEKPELKKKPVKPLPVLPKKAPLSPVEPPKKSKLVDDNKGCVNKSDKEK